MITTKGFMVRIAILAGALAISGCTMPDEVQLLDNSGLQTAFGNAGHDRDDGGFGNFGNHGNSGSQNGGSSGTAGDSGSGSFGGDSGPGNSGFGRGSHANAGGGNGSETADGDSVSADNPDLDPGQSGNSSGRNGSND